MTAKTRALFLAGITMVAAGGWFAVKSGIVPDVIVTPARRGVAISAATGNVTVIPSLDTRVVAPEQGILIKFDHKEGDTVKKDEIIAEIDQGALPSQLKESRINLEKLNGLMIRLPHEVQLEAMKKTFEISKQLADSGNYTKDDLEKSRREIELMELTVRQERSGFEFDKAKLENQIADINRQIERRTIRAGYDAVIMAPAVLQGDQIFSGNTICNLTSRGKALKAEVNQDDLTTVTNSKRVLLKLFSQGDRVFEGKLSQVLPIGNSSTQRFTVFINVAKLPDEVLSGQTGEATFIADEHRDALLIPRRAIIGGECYVVKDGAVEKRAIKIGYTTLTDAEIVSGVKEGELVVTKDADLRRDKERANPVPEIP